MIFISGAVDDVVESGRDFESSNTSQGSGLDLSSLDAKMQEIEDSILEMDDPTSVAMPTQDEIKKEEEDKEEGDETDSDSEDEDEGGKSHDHTNTSHDHICVSHDSTSRRGWPEDWC